MFIGPPKLVFIKTTEGGGQTALRPGAPKGQTILVAPAPTPEATPAPTPAPTVQVIATPSPDRESPVETTPRVLRRQAAERKYGKKQRTETNNDEESKEKESEEVQDSSSSNGSASKLDFFSFNLFRYCFFVHWYNFVKILIKSTLIFLFNILPMSLSTLV